MIEITEALNGYHARVAQATLDQWPEVWAVHYSATGLLGELEGRIGDGGEAEAVYWALVPFAFSAAVVTSFVIFESSKGSLDTDLLDADRILYATRLHFDGSSTTSTQWIIRYTIGDRGVRLYDTPYQSAFFVPKLFECVGVMMDRRLTSALYTFEQAMAAAVRGDDGFIDV